MSLWRRRPSLIMKRNKKEKVKRKSEETKPEAVGADQGGVDSTNLLFCAGF